MEDLQALLWLAALISGAVTIGGWLHALRLRNLSRRQGE